MMRATYNQLIEAIDRTIRKYNLIADGVKIKRQCMFCKVFIECKDCPLSYIEGTKRVICKEHKTYPKSYVWDNEDYLAKYDVQELAERDRLMRYFRIFVGKYKITDCEGIISNKDLTVFKSTIVLLDAGYLTREI